ncbi:MAG: dihydropteroate synthase [Thermoleophilia bacterium]|nr:dihydropteroate synthase [Thermoleophilia bacterium]
MATFETVVRSATREVIIGGGRPVVLIGERINPTGKKRLAEALRAGDLSVAKEEALAQVAAGADILDVNAGATGVDEIEMLPRVVEAVAEVVDVPLCIDSRKTKALAAALAVCPGRPIVNSVTGEEASLEEVLPLVKEYGVPVIGLTLDEKGIPADPSARVEIAHKIVERAESYGIPRHDVIIDCLTLSLGANVKAGLATLEATRRVRDELGVNQTQGCSNISHGLPNRPILNAVYLGMAIEAGLTCPTVDVAQVRLAALSADLILGRDNYAMRFISAFREAQKAAQGQ